MDTTRPADPNYRFMLVKLSTEVSDLLEDVRYALTKRERRRVTKRELIDRAIRELARNNQ